MKVFTGILLLFIFYMVLFGEAKYLEQYIIFMIVFLSAFGYSGYKTISLDQEDFEKSVSSFVVLKLSDNRFHPTYKYQYIGYENVSGMFWLSDKAVSYQGYDSYEEVEGICRSYYDKYLKLPT